MTRRRPDPDFSNGVSKWDTGVRVPVLVHLVAVGGRVVNGTSKS